VPGGRAGPRQSRGGQAQVGLGRVGKAPAGPGRPVGRLGLPWFLFSMKTIVLHSKTAISCEKHTFY
jgi:hypothetical protein